jgi:hypothetical protein
MGLRWIAGARGAALPLVLGLVLGLVFGAGALVAGCGGAGGSTSGSEVFVQGAGEVFCEPAGDPGPESFTGSSLLVDHVVPSPEVMASVTTVPALAVAAVQMAALAGDTLGLYGGSRSKVTSNKEAQLAFLQQNLDKAKAFCAALNADPTLKWSGGDQVTPDQLAAYFAELTPLLLTRDIRVTNHGYRDGGPTPRQSILQAGQLVLVDRYGVPRTRCECGNPLIPPKAVTAKPKYTGSPWPNFNPGTVVVIQSTTVIIDVFVLIDVLTGQTFTRPAGTSGGNDTEGATGTTVTTALGTTTTIEAVTTTTAGTSTSTTTGSTVPGLSHGPLSGTAIGWFGEGDASAVNGSSGRQKGTVTYPQGVIGQAFGFDGSSYVEVPDGPDLTLGSGDFTIALWVYFDVVAGRDPFISHDEGGGQYNKWTFWYDKQGHDRMKGQGALRFHVNIANQATTDVIAAAWDPQPAAWYHVAVTRAQGIFRLYLNGAVVESQASDIVIPDPAAPLAIGRAEAFFHTGRIDEVQLWHKALSDADIQATYLAGMQGQ